MLVYYARVSITIADADRFTRVKRGGFLMMMADSPALGAVVHRKYHR